MRKIYQYALYIGIFVITIQLTACSTQKETASPANPTPIATDATSGTATSWLSPLPSTTSSAPIDKLTHPASVTVTSTPRPTATPLMTFTPSISPTPTTDFPEVSVNVANAHCRYGPGSAYLHAADLYEGDHGLVWNRNYAGTWLWVRFDKLNYACWVATSVAKTKGDIFSVATYFPALPQSTLYGPPQQVAASRNGDQVLVTWEEVWMTEDDDRGYLIEARLCQNGHLIDVAVHTDGTAYTFLDESSCEGESRGKLYAVEKHGYTDPLPIPWP